MANKLENVQLSPGRVVIIAALAVFVLVFLILRSQGFVTESSESQPAPSATTINIPAACIYNSAIPAHSPMCPPHLILAAGQPMLTSALPGTGVCSIELANSKPVVAVDFTQYIGEGKIITHSLWRANGEGGITVALPISVYDVVRLMSPELSNDEQLTYAISPESYASLEKALPSLGRTLNGLGMNSKNHYLTTHRCLPLAPIPE